ncbi:MAG: hypothetical protein ACK44E_08165 [Anaerolineales bacterium]
MEEETKKETTQKWNRRKPATHRPLDEETKRAMVQKLNLDKPILAMQEEEQSLTLYLLGGEVVRVELAPAQAQLTLDRM